jgi:phospholipase D1/2
MSFDQFNDGIVQEGRNCWRIRKSNRAAFLIDSASYFAAFVEALERAERQVIMLGWDIDSRVKLIPGQHSRARPSKLDEVLKAAVIKKPDLHIYMLFWRFSILQTLDREFFPIPKFEWAHERLHFRFDANAPLGASHHQKIIVVDDRVAFSGGIDLAMRRWDRPEHATADPLRVDIDGKLYPPTHDIQMMVDGDAAASLGDLARKRWLRATGQVLAPAPAEGKDPWPSAVRPDCNNINVAIARTEPPYKKHPEVREVEQLYLDSFVAARRYIYIENQYITSAIIGDAIIRRLQEKNGPEVILVVPERTSGWLSKLTMDVCRTRRLREIRSNDPYGRLRVYYPTVPGLGGKEYLEVHAKICVVDDTLVRVGSANLSDRSMGLDTECDLAIEAKENDRIRQVIADFRNRLLSQHLGVPKEKIAETIKTEKSLLKAIERLQGNERTLLPLEREANKWLERIMPENEVLDVKHPVNRRRMLQGVLPKDRAENVKAQLIKSALVLLTMFALAGIWRFTPLGDWFSAQNIVKAASQLRDNPLMPLFVYAFYLIGGLVFFPIVVMIVATALIFAPLEGFFYSLTGSLLSAAFTYFLGRILGRNVVSRLSGNYMERLGRRLGKNDVMALMALRIIPIAPFTAVNVVAGASNIRFGAYMLTTFLGLFPGIFAITIFGHGLAVILRKPTMEGVTLLGVWAVLTVAVLYVMRKWFSKHTMVEEKAGEIRRRGKR